MKEKIAKTKYLILKRKNKKMLNSILEIVKKQNNNENSIFTILQKKAHKNSQRIG